MSRIARRAAGAAAVVLALAFTAGCSQMSQLRWPWSDVRAPAPEAANELTITPGEGTSGASIPQYWKRNTLVLDMQAVSGSGSIFVEPRAGKVWPVRLALRVMPGQVGKLEVHGEQRVVLPITTAGSSPIDLELSPGVYNAKTSRIIVRWAPNAG